MALIKCPECGKEISDKAAVCINCGFPIREFLAEQNTTSAEGSAGLSAAMDNPVVSAGSDAGAVSVSGPDPSKNAAASEKPKMKASSYIWLVVFLAIGVFIYQNYSPTARANNINSKALKTDEIVGVWEYDGYDVHLNGDHTVDFDGCDYISGKWTVISDDQNMIMINYKVTDKEPNEAVPDATIYQYIRTEKRLVNVKDADQYLRQ